MYTAVVEGSDSFAQTFTSHIPGTIVGFDNK
jgi:hypothetical protein